MAIPKNIINAWFGKGPKGPLFNMCLESQADFAASNGWAVIEINEDTIDPAVLETPFFKGVMERGEFVKCTEFARIWGLWKHGGIYMDADVEVLKTLDGLRDCSFFIGREDSEHLNGAVMGSVPKGVVVNSLCEHFPLATQGKEGAHFYGPGYLTRQLPKIMHATTGSVEYGPEFFYPSHWRTPDVAVITENTVAHHHWAKSWVGKPGC